MAQTLEVRAETGLSLTVKLFPYGSDTAANGSGDTLTEATNRKGLYTATVSESISGWHTAHIFEAGTCLAVHDVYLTDTATTHRCESAPIRVYQGTDGTKLGSAEIVYSADIRFTRDQDDTTDRYAVRWYKNGARGTVLTSPVINVTQQTGAALITNQAMTDVASGMLVRTATGGARIPVGEQAEVLVSATIDGATRYWSRWVSRDSGT